MTYSPRRNARTLKVAALAAAIAAAAGSAGAAPLSPFGSTDLLGASADSDTSVAPLRRAPTPFIILLKEPAAGGAQSPLARRADGSVDMQSNSARSYVEDLRGKQNRFLQDASTRIGRPLQAIGRKFQFQHAANGVVARITANEAMALAQDPRVARIVPMTMTRLNTDRGPALIGAPAIWGDGPSSPDSIFGTGFETPEVGGRGEGVVVGIIDTGLNFDSPSFAASAGGYTHVNPLGEGNYLGLCGPDGADNPAAPECNSKVIGAHDFVDALLADIQAFDPAASDGAGVEDENGHGSHTAGTAAGNPVTAELPSGPIGISGVAPRANLIAYDACYTTGSGQGSCLNVSLLAAVNQAVADGVDVINYSIGGGNDPWNDPISMAFLSANLAGTFIAAAAGNSGPFSASVGHVEPWVTTVAASTHGRGAFANTFSVTGPEPVPPALQDLVVSVAGDGAPMTAPIEGGLGYDAANELLCSAPAAGSLTGKIAVVKRGTCAFDIKVVNAQDAGASAMLLFNNVEAALNPSMPNAAIPVVVTPLSTGTAIASFVDANPGAEGRIDHPAKPLPNVADQVARFSSRGPSFMDQLKPDVTAPGVAIIAPVQGDAGAFGVYNGTSMASPHVAGAAALLRQQQPGWSPEQIKSALMLTAKTEMTLEETGGVAGPLQRGAGRIQVDQAVSPGLLLDESSINYNLADPAFSDGFPDTLNVASFNLNDCVGACSWERRVQNVSGRTVTWTASVDGVPGSVTPAQFTLAAGASQTLSLEIGANDVALDTLVDGQVVLTPDDAGLPVLHMPVVLHAAPPALSLSADALQIDVVGGETASVDLDIGNVGNGSIDWSDHAGVQQVPTVYQPRSTNNGLVSASFTTGTSAVVADDFTLSLDATIQSIDVDGFFWSPYYLSFMTDFAASLHWEIYADAAGYPAGGPGVVGGAAPVWSHTAALVDGEAPGVTPGIPMTLDLAAAGVATPTLTPGRYWLVAYPEFTNSPSEGGQFWWYRFIGATQNGFSAKSTNTEPAFGGTPGAAAWTDINQSWSGHYDAAMVVRAEQDCGAEWLSLASAGGSVGTAQSSTVAVNVDATALTAGEYVAQVCLQTSDPDHPWVLLPVQVTVSAPPAPAS